MSKITKDNLEKLLSLGRKVSRDEISSLIGVSGGEARAYYEILSNVDVLSEDKRSDDICTYVVSGCWHTPFHDKVLYDGFKKLLVDIRPKGFVLAGDFLDMNALGEYERGKMLKTGVTLEDEYCEGNAVLDELDYILGDGVKKYWLTGNHTARWHRWKADVNNNKYGDLMNPFKALKLKDRGYEVNEDYNNGYIELGALQVFHGIYHSTHASKVHLDRLRRNCMFVHTHRMQSYIEGDFGAWNIGFMGDKNAPCFDYASRGMREAWSNGFALVHVEGERFFVDMINVVDSHFVYNGKKY